MKIKGAITIHVKFKGAWKLMILRCFIILYVQILSGFDDWYIQDLIWRWYDTIKTCRWNSFNFSWVVYYKKYVKIRFKNRGPPCYFLEVKRSKILQKLNKRDYFYNILGFIFFVSRAKTDLHSKYIFNFVCGSFFKQDHLLNLFILRVYAKRWANCARISKQKLRIIPWQKIWGYGVSFWINESFVCRT